MLTTTLEVSLARSGASRCASQHVGRHRGGPEVLLGWLETQLGLSSPQVATFRRVAELAAALEENSRPSFAESLERDRWATAADLLARLEVLRLAGWDGSPAAGLPALVDDLARVLERAPLQIPGHADRLLAVLAALDAGQALPPHSCTLDDPFTAWPRLWRAVIERLTTKTPTPIRRHGHPTTALGRVQAALLDPAPIDQLVADASIRFVRAHSATVAADAVAAMLAAEPDAAADTVVCCADSAVARLLDDRLARRGVPTMGATSTTTAHPARQVLPLALELCWEPVDPELLLAFLSLRMGPIPTKAASRLAAALAAQPGLGSRAWERELQGLRSSGDDSDAAAARAVELWLGGDRVPLGSPLPTSRAVERCHAVAAWAARLAGPLHEDAVASRALLAASDEALATADVLRHAGDGITSPQLRRMLEAVSGGGLDAPGRLEAEGGPRWVASLAEIDEPCERLIWIGLTSDDRPRTPWSGLERRALRAAGVEIDDGSAALAALRDAERRGLARVRDRVLAVALAEPDGGERPPHPVWLQAQSLLGGEPIDLDRLLAEGSGEAVRPWRLATVASHAAPAPARTPVWRLDPGLLRDRHSSSASELETRLGCPLKWVFRYPARLRQGAVAGLPSGSLLEGTFAHQVFQEVFGSGGPLPPPDEAEAAVRAVADERLAFDAAPLARRAQSQERLRLVNAIARSARELVSALAAGGYRIAAMEHGVHGSVAGRDLEGRIDCLAVTEDGREAVVDFKHRGHATHRARLEAGRATQLATYAHGRRQETGRWPAVAYLILADGVLLTPEGSPLLGTKAIVPGPSIAQTWAAFERALAAAEGWIADGRVPVRPLQESEEWPAGAGIVLEKLPSDPTTDPPPPCRYCEYGLLCGQKAAR